jgi:ketosteroid isomerase-like protein
MQQIGLPSGTLMALYGRPIRSSLMVSAILLAGVFMGPCVQIALASHSLPLREKKHDAKRQVEALEEQWRQAQLSGDVDTMDKLLSDDYIGISMTGQVNTKAQQLDRMRAHTLVLTKVDLGEMQVKLVGSIAIVTSRAEVEGTSEGGAIKGVFRYTRVYQRLPSGAWKITSFEATRVPGSGSQGRSGEDSKATQNVPPTGPSL